LPAAPSASGGFSRALCDLRSRNSDFRKGFVEKNLSEQLFDSPALAGAIASPKRIGGIDCGTVENKVAQWGAALTTGFSQATGVATAPPWCGELKRCPPDRAIPRYLRLVDPPMSYLSPQFDPDVFVSYSHGDPYEGRAPLRDWTQALIRRLGDQVRSLEPKFKELHLWMDPEIDPTAELTDELGKRSAIRPC
jgi:hypothetical protein